MLKLALRNLFRQKGRTLITLLSIVFGVASLILAGGFVDDILSQLRDATIKSRLGYLQIHRAGYSELGRRDPYKYLIEDPVSLTEELAKLPTVVDLLQRLEFSGFLNNEKTDRAVQVEGVEPDKEAELGTFLQILAGRQLTSEDHYAAVIGEGVAVALDLEPGDFVTLLGNTTDGGMNSLEIEIVGVFRSFSRDFDARAVRVPLATAQELLNTAAIHSIVFSLSSVEAVDPLTAQLERRLPADQYEVQTWLELDDFYPKAVELYRSQFGFLQGIILGIVLLSVANSVSMTANERVGEFGTLRAIGHTARYVYRLLIVENTILGLFGATLGVAVGVGLAWAISRVGIPMPPPPNANTGYTAYIAIVPWVCFFAFVIGVAAAVLSAALVCRRPSRVPIAEALRENI